MYKINNEKAQEIANKIGLNLDEFEYEFDFTCYATNDQEDELWGFCSEKDREESIERRNNYWRTALIEMLVG